MPKSRKELSMHHIAGVLLVDRIFTCDSPGALHFGTKFTNDLCLYPENFTFKVRVALNLPAKY